MISSSVGLGFIRARLAGVDTMRSQLLVLFAGSIRIEVSLILPPPMCLLIIQESVGFLEGRGTNKSSDLEPWRGRENGGRQSR